MELSSKLVVAVLVCMTLVACNKSDEEKVLAASHTLSAKESAAIVRKMATGGLPPCAARDDKGVLITPGGCTHQQRLDWNNRN